MIRRMLFAVAALVALTAPRAGAAEVTVGQKGKAFSKTEVTIKVGDTIVFENDDDVTHNVFCKAEGCQFNTKGQAPAAKFSQKFEKEGTFEVRCAIHPKMKLTVHVTK
jgi:plastocyanin